MINGKELFRFESYNNWVNWAERYFKMYSNDTPREYILCFDSIGRYCRIGKEFIRARDQDTFPIIAYDMRC
jgi:hypothetical protein